MQKVVPTHKIWLGRAGETAAIEAGIHALEAGQGSAFLVTGDAGIGKTRLAVEASRVASSRGVAVHWGRAWEAGGAPAYFPIAQVIRSIAPAAPVLDLLLGPVPGARERFQLLEAVDAFLRDLGPAPHLVVMDDLHAADSSSLELLHFIVRDLRARPLMVIGTYRDAEARLAPDRRSLLARLAREATVLPLAPFDREEVSAFVSVATGVDPSSDRVAELYAQTEGNPLFLRELLLLSPTAGRRPEGIREVVRARLSLIPDSSRALLEAAAVLGREFDARTLAGIAGVSELDARGLLEPAAHAGIVEVLRDAPRWRFSHVLLQESLYDDLSRERRCALHLAAANELGSRPDTRPLSELAHHLAGAVPAVSPAAAARASMDAGEHGLALLAFEDARASFERAATLLDGVPGEDRSLAEAILGAARASMRLAEVDRGREASRRAAMIARRLGDGDLFARSVLAAGYEHAPWVRDEVAIADLEEALVRLPSGDGALRARCMAQLAADRQPEPDMRPLHALALEAVAMARRVGDGDALRATLSAAIYATAVHAEPAEKIPIEQETLRLALATNDKRVALRAHAFLAGAFFELGDRARARPHEIAVTELVRAFPHGRFAWLASLLDGTIAIAGGRFDEARTVLERAEASLARDEARGALLAAAPLGVACLTERYEDHARLEASVRARFGALKYPLGVCLGEMLITQLYGRAGNETRARAQLDIVLLDPTLSAIEEPSWLALLVDACYLAGDATLASRLARAFASRADRFAWLGPLTLGVDLPYARHLGLLAEVLGRPDEAVSHLESALALATRAEAHAHLARLHFELARALRRRGAAADVERAATLAAEGRALARRHDQTSLIDRFDAGVRPPRAIPQTPSVSAASLDRLRLEQEGDLWSIVWQGRTLRLRSTRGLALLARLVERPGNEMHVLELASFDGAPLPDQDAGPLLDPQATSAYRRRLGELRETLAEAEAFADVERAERARAEIEALTRELSRAVGIAGRDRRAAHTAERARTAVQKRLREAIKRIEAELPDLGTHLDQTVRTGTYCGYFPSGRRG